MRFKAELQDVTSFSRLLTALVPLSKLAMVKLKPDSVHLICLADGPGPAQVWCTISNNAVFNSTSFKLESNTNNEIYLEVNTEAFSRALKSASGSTEVVIKLAKKFGDDPGGGGKGARPVLSLIIKGASRFGRTVEIQHHVGVRVKKPAEVEAMKEPLCPPPDVSILVPGLAIMRTVVERLKTISNKIHVSANYGGEFRLKAVSDDAKVQTEWRGLKHPEPVEGEDTPQPTDRSRFSSVCVEAKSLLKALSCHQIGTVTIGCVCERHCLILYVYLGDARSEGENGVLTYFLPAVSGEDDD